MGVGRSRRAWGLQFGCLEEDSMLIWSFSWWERPVHLVWIGARSCLERRRVQILSSDRRLSQCRPIFTSTWTRPRVLERHQKASISRPRLYSQTIVWFRGKICRLAKSTLRLVPAVMLQHFFEVVPMSLKVKTRFRTSGFSESSALATNIPESLDQGSHDKSLVYLALPDSQPEFSWVFPRWPCAGAGQRKTRQPLWCLLLGSVAHPRNAGHEVVTVPERFCLPHESSPTAQPHSLHEHRSSCASASRSGPSWRATGSEPITRPECCAVWVEGKRQIQGSASVGQPALIVLLAPQWPLCRASSPRWPPFHLSSLNHDLHDMRLLRHVVPILLFSVFSCEWDVVRSSLSLTRARRCSG